MDTGTAVEGFQVELENFSGPFDLLLGLISKRRLDVTEIALAEVTDEFISYTTELKDKANLAEISQFLLVAATLLDLKTARLLPHEEGEEVLDLELLEARDLLFARLLQYKAYKSVSGYLAEAMAAGSIRAPRDVALEAEFQDVLPPLEINIGPGELAGIFATVLQRDHTPPSVAVDHIHLPLVSVSEQRGHILALLRAGESRLRRTARDRREHPGRRRPIPRTARTVQGRTLRFRPARTAGAAVRSTAPK